RTESGLALLILSALLLWIPVIEIGGLFVGAIAVILIILGAEAFGWRHQMLVWASVLLFILAQIAGFVLVGSFASSVRSAPSAGTAAADQILSALDGLIRGLLVLVVIASISEALIAFDLSDLAGRVLLVGAVVVQSLVSVLLLLCVFGPLIHQAEHEQKQDHRDQRLDDDCADEQDSSREVVVQSLVSVILLLFVFGPLIHQAVADA